MREISGHARGAAATEMFGSKSEKGQNIHGLHENQTQKG